MTQHPERSGQAVAEAVDPRAAQPLVHHGRTWAAWVGSVGASVGAIVSAIGFFLDISWPVVWVGFAIVFVSCVAALALRNLGYGQKES